MLCTLLVSECIDDTLFSDVPNVQLKGNTIAKIFQTHHNDVSSSMQKKQAVWEATTIPPPLAS